MFFLPKLTYFDRKTFYFIPRVRLGWGYLVGLCRYFWSEKGGSKTPDFARFLAIWQGYRLAFSIFFRENFFLPKSTYFDRKTLYFTPRGRSGCISQDFVNTFEEKREFSNQLILAHFWPFGKAIDLPLWRFFGENFCFQNRSILIKKPFILALEPDQGVTCRMGNQLLSKILDFKFFQV